MDVPPDEFERVRTILARRRRLGATFDELWVEPRLAAGGMRMSGYMDRDRALAGLGPEG